VTTSNTKQSSAGDKQTRSVYAGDSLYAACLR